MDLFTATCFRDNMKMYSTIFSVMFLLTSFSLNAADLCGDFAQAACAQEPKEDPSGKILSASELAQKISKARETSRVNTLKAVNEHISRDPAFARLVDEKFACKADCDAVRIVKVADIVERGVIGGPDPQRKVDLRTLYDIAMEPTFKLLVDEVSHSYHYQITSKDKRNEIENVIGPKVIELARERVAKLQIDEAVKINLNDRLSRLTIKTGGCGMLNNDELYPEATTQYSASKNQISICESALAKYESKIAIAGYILKEIARTFDPCGIVAGKKPAIEYVINQPRDPQYPVKGLIECLRANLPADAPYTPDCSKDKIGGVFADWFRAEVLPKYISENFKSMSKEERQAAYMNASVRLCDQPDRMNAIFAAQPEIRQQMGCAKDPSNSKYCEAPANGETTKAPAKIEAHQ